MKKAILCAIAVLLLAAPAWAQYNVRLKNGSVLRGVSKYEEVNGQLRFQYIGGMMGIPIEDVERIEEARTGSILTPGVGPPASPSSGGSSSMSMAPTLEEPPDTGPLKQRIAEVDKRIAEIGKKEEAYDAFKKEYDQVRLRIEVLFQKGIAAAKQQGGDPAKWFQFLPAQEREWAQLNTLKKNQMQKEMKDREAEMLPLLSEKKGLIEEKQQLEEKLRAMEVPY